MKKRILFTLSLLWPFLINAQNSNPFVSQGIITPSPLYDVASKGVGEISFNVGNSGDDIIPFIKGQELMVYVVFSKGVPDDRNPLAAISGGFANHFNWKYDSVKRTFTGIQNQPIGEALNGGVGEVKIKYRVTENTVGVGPQNGFKVNIVPPAYLIEANSKNDDEVSSYTWTVLKFTTNPDYEITKENELVKGNVSVNDRIERGTRYSNPPANPKNPSDCMPKVESDGSFTFTCSKSGEYVFQVPICEPEPSVFCTSVPLTIKVVSK